MATGSGEDDIASDGKFANMLDSANEVRSDLGIEQRWKMGITCVPDAGPPPDLWTTWASHHVASRLR